MVLCDGVWKYYRQSPVLRGISLQLAQGQTHIVIGPSGCGKSTLIRLMAGLIRPDRGAVNLGERDATTLPDAQKPLVFGYLIQDGGLFPHLTGWGNVLLPAVTQNRDSGAVRRRAQELCELVELEPGLLSQYPRQLSGGQRQRVALVRSLILDPPLLFLDEPMGALDPLVRSSLQIALRNSFQKLKKTVVFVTHDLAEAAFFADTVTLMKEGEVEQHGPFEELVESPRTPFVTEYLSAQRPPPRLGALK